MRRGVLALKMILRSTLRKLQRVIREAASGSHWSLPKKKARHKAGLESIFKVLALKAFATRYVGRRA